MNELELLRRYAQENSQEAFAELVRRHLDLVHSAALRQVRSPQLAEEVAQSVFLDLARQAGRLRPDTQLGAWLYAVTRRTAIDVIRRESRRQARERSAAEPAASPAPPWVRAEDLLDDAIASLRETDRQALLLRYFQGRSLREVGVALAISDDTAQKRISRAIEKLQGYFAKEGAAVGSAALVSGLGQHAVRSAPVGLIAKILAATAAKRAWSSAVYAASKGAVAGLLQKMTLVATTLAVGAGLLESGAWILQARALQTARQQRQALETQASRLAAENLAAENRLRSADREIDRQLADAQPGSDAALEAKMNQWLGRISRLKAALKQRPNQDVPQLRYLTDQDWLVIGSQANLESEDGVRRALSNLRNRAQVIVAQMIQSALSRYLEATGGMPTTALQLAPYFDEPPPPGLLDQYAIVPNTFPARRNASTTAIALKNPVDLEYDLYWQTGVGQSIMGNALSTDVMSARRAYSKANHGATTKDPSLLQPYLRWPADPEQIQRWFESQSAPPRQ